MVNRVRQYLHTKRFGAATLAGVALSFLLIGLGVASDPHGTGASEAKRLGTGAQVREVPANPSSFADLANKLGPTVVNIKVTKVE
ncbi:MAG: hypothetical protein ACE5I9_12555, partial [Candidatus Methylomirabilales bacterium]